MSQTKTIACDGCGKKTEDSGKPILIADLPLRDTDSWVRVEVPKVDCFEVSIRQMDYCHKCWTLAINAITVANTPFQKVG